MRRVVNIERHPGGITHNDGEPRYCIRCTNNNHVARQTNEKIPRRRQAVGLVVWSDGDTFAYCEFHLPKGVGV